MDAGQIPTSCVTWNKVPDIKVDKNELEKQQKAGKDTCNVNNVNKVDDGFKSESKSSKKETIKDLSFVDNQNKVEEFTKNIDSKDIDGNKSPYLKQGLGDKIANQLGKENLKELQKDVGAKVDNKYGVETHEKVIEKYGDRKDFNKAKTYEINWALELEQKVKQGYSPSKSETKTYADIAGNLTKDFKTPIDMKIYEKIKSEKEEFTKSFDPKDIVGKQDPYLKHDIADKIANKLGKENLKELQKDVGVKVDNKYGVETHEKVIEKYSYRKDFDSASTKDINRALELEHKVKDGYNPNEKETKDYSNVAENLKKDMSTSIDTKIYEKIKSGK